MCDSAAIAAWIGRLESLREGPSAMAALVACGPAAVPALADVLRYGKPGSIFQPRQLAVRALAELGAWPALLEYLEHPAAIADPVVRNGEDAVRSTAAEELARFPSEEVFARLARLAEQSRLPGVVRALGGFERLEAVPLLLPLLEDDVCRPAVEEALRRPGARARPRLLAALTASGAAPVGPSRRRRQGSILRLLAELPPQAGGWDVVQPLTEDADPELAMRANCLGLALAPPENRPHRAAAVVRMLPRVDGFLQAEARAALARGYPWAAAAVEKEIVRRRAAPERARRGDTVLPMLEALHAAMCAQGWAPRRLAPPARL